MNPTLVWRSPEADGRRWLLLLLAVALLGGLLPAITPQQLSLPAAAISSEQALSAVAQPADPWSRFAQYRATYAPEGLAFQPRFGGPRWEWRIAAVNAGAAPLAGVNLGAVEPTRGAGQVDYERGAIVERYIERDTTTIEQQFIIPAPLELGGQNLEILGAVSSHGSFAALEQGWEWRTDEGRVTLGTVTVFDATGATLPATMEASASGTRIVVDGAALAAAAYPVTVDPLIGTDNVQITNVSNPAANNNRDALEPAVAYSPELGQFLVVYASDAATFDAAAGTTRLDNEFEIYGQFVSGSDGTPVGQPFRISDIGNDLANDVWDAFSPTVAYAPPGDYSNEFGTTAWEGGFLVGWVADNNNPSGAGNNSDTAFETYVQLVSNSGQLLIDGDDRISGIIAESYNQFFPNNTAPDWDAFAPSMDFNPVDGEFLVCWSDDRDAGRLPTQAEIDAGMPSAIDGGAYEIRCQLFSIAPGPNRPYFGSVFSNTVLTISDMGPSRADLDVNYKLYDAYTPDVVYNSVNNEWLVVWAGDDTTVIDAQGEQEEFEIYAQILDANGAERTTTPYRNDHRYTQVGGTGAGSCGDGCDAFYPRVAHNPERNHYLVAFVADNTNGQEDVYTSLRTNTGSSPTNGVILQRITTTGGVSGATAGNLDAFEVDVAYDATVNEWLIAWRGENTTNDTFQVYGQRLDATTPVDADLTPSNKTVPISEKGTTDELLGTVRGIERSFFTSSNMGGGFAFDGEESGQPVAGPFNVAPQIASSGLGDFMIVWAGPELNNGNNVIEVHGRLAVYGNRAPSLTVPAETIVAEATSPAGAPVNFTVSSTDLEDGALTPVCTIPDNVTVTSGSTFPIGTTTVTCTATDNGTPARSSTANFDVTVQDTTDPVLDLPDPITAQALVPAGVAVEYTATATDIADAAVAVVCAPTSGSTFTVGETTVNCTATDDAGNETAGSFTVTVNGDTADPVLTLPDPISTEATGPSGAVVNYTATATDTIDTSVSAVCAPAPGSTFALGETTVNCTATDDFGNEAAGSFTVTVADTTKPTLTVPANISTQAEEETGKVVTFTAPSATDTVDTSVTVVCVSAPTAGLSSGSVFPVGETTITCTASDDSGNEDVKSFKVTVAAPDAKANLALTIGNLPATVQQGADLSVSFTVANSGPNAATGTTLTVPVPAGMTFKSGTAGCALQGGQVRCAMNSIANGTNKSVTIVFTVGSAAATGNRTISASVSAAEADPTPANNASSKSLQVVPAPAPGFKLYLPILFK